MDFTADQRLAITNAIIKLTDLSRGSNLIQRPPQGETRLEDKRLVFYEKEKQILPNYHNIPLYVTALIHYMELRRALINPGSFRTLCLYQH